MPRSNAGLRTSVKDFVSCLNFTSNSARVDVKSGRIISTATNASISAWVKLNANGGGNGYAIYCERAAAGVDIYKLQISTARKLTFTHRNDASTLTQVAGNTYLRNGEWYQLGVVKVGTAVTLYVNGTSDGTGTLNGNDVLTNASTLSTIGYDTADTSGGWLNAKVDELRLWDTNLSSTQVGNVYLNGSAGVNPVGEWLMNEGSGSTIADTGTGANNGTLTSVSFSTDVKSVTRSTSTRSVASTRTIVS